MTAETHDAEQSADHSGRRKKIIIIAAILCVVIAFSVCAYFFLFASPNNSEEVQPEITPPLPAIYVPLKPQFVLNFQVENRLRYIQIDVVVKVRSDLAKAAVENHAPTIRSALINLFGRLDFHGMRLPENRQLVADEALAIVNQELARIGPELAAEAILFETFVLQ